MSPHAACALQGICRNQAGYQGRINRFNKPRACQDLPVQLPGKAAKQLPGLCQISVIAQNAAL